MRFAAYAKINLFLDVVAERGDGYHDIVTVMQEVDLADEVIIGTGKHGIELACDWSGVKKGQRPLGHENIAYRAAVLLRELLREKRGAVICIRKRIPVAAGLGGGSSDAAAVMKGLLKLWKREVPLKILEKLALGIGSDVPYFLRGGCCLCEGRGEVIKPLSPYWKEKPLDVILINPGIEVSAGDAYAGIKKIKPVDGKYLKNVLSYIKSGSGCQESLFNKLEEPVFEKYPLVEKIKEALITGGADIAMMSGSGPTLFGVFSDGKKASVAARVFKKKYPFTYHLTTVS